MPSKAIIFRDEDQSSKRGSALNRRLPTTNRPSFAESEGELNTATARQMVQLQRTIGNQRVSRMIAQRRALQVQRDPDDQLEAIPKKLTAPAIEVDESPKPYKKFEYYQNLFRDDSGAETSSLREQSTPFQIPSHS